MKTYKQLGDLIEVIYDDVEHGKMITATNRLRAIQLDAMKEGMTMAAELCKAQWDNMDIPAERYQVCKAQIAIERDRDNLKELP